MTIEIYRVETAMSVAPKLRLRPEKEKEGTHACAAVAVMARTITCLRMLPLFYFLAMVCRKLSASLELIKGKASRKMYIFLAGTLSKIVIPALLNVLKEGGTV